MTRALVDIPQDTINQLDMIAAAMGISRSETIRQAIQLWLDNKNKEKRHSAFGILKNKINCDGVEFQDKIRSEW